MQAQPNKIKLEARDEQKYKDKLLLKAKVICDSANRLWREFLSRFCAGHLQSGLVYFVTRGDTNRPS